MASTMVFKLIRALAVARLLFVEVVTAEQAVNEGCAHAECAVSLLQHDAVRIYSSDVPSKHHDLLHERRSRKPEWHPKPSQVKIDAKANMENFDMSEKSENLEGAVQKKDTSWFIGDNGKVQEGGPSVEEAAAFAADPNEILPIYPAPMKYLRTDPVEFHLPVGAVDMVTRLTDMVLSVTHETTQVQWALSGSDSKAATNQKAAFAMLTKIENDEKFTVMDIADITEMASESQSAESASANHVLITASHLAMLVHGFRGEDYGANYNFDTDNPAKQTFQGDIMKEMSTKPWTDGVVKYCMSPDVSPRIENLVGKAMEHYTRAIPFLQFEDVGHKSGKSDSIREDQKCESSPAIFVSSSDDYGCFAHRGMMAKDSQSLQLNDPGCSLIGTVLHMLGHSLGLGHEHFAKSTEVLSHQVKHGRVKNFQFEDTPGETISSDSLSIMHYDPYAFAEDPRKPTLAGKGFNNMGQRMALAQSDVDKLVDFYSSEGDVASALDGLGCVNAPMQKCPALSSKMPFCRTDDFNNCCACGGGTKVQCYKNFEDSDVKTCPRVQAMSYVSLVRIMVLASIALVPLIGWCCVSGRVIAKADAALNKSPRYPKSSSPRDMVLAGYQVSNAEKSGGPAGSTAGGAPGSADEDIVDSDAVASSKQGSAEDKKALLAALPPSTVTKKTGAAGLLASLGWGAPVSEGLSSQADRAPATKLSKEASERFQGDFTPMGGGFASGREWAPVDVLVAGTATPGTAGNMEALAEDPAASSGGAASSSTSCR